MLSQSAPVPSQFAQFREPAQPALKPLVPPAAPAPLALPSSLSEHDDGLEVWAVTGQLGRSFYSSSMPSNFAERSFSNGAFGGAARATSMTGDGTPSATSSGLRSPMSDDGTTTTTSTAVSAAAAATGTAAGVSWLCLRPFFCSSFFFYFFFRKGILTRLTLSGSINRCIPSTLHQLNKKTHNICCAGNLL
jgi:hypothetical protein